jgi:hypothetical protein
MCSILCWILYIWEALCWNFSHFALIHALSTRGRSLCMIWTPRGICKVFKVVWEGFEKFGAGPVSWGGLTAPRRSDPRGAVWPALAGGLTGLGGVSRFLRFVAFPCCITALVQGGVLWLRGACMCAGGALCVVRALDWWFVPFAWAWFLSWMCRAVALS